MIAIGFAIVGLAGLVLLLAHTGLGEVAHAIGTVGWSGLALLAGWQLLVTIPLGFAWAQVCPGAGARLAIWGRLVREAATNCLPFTTVGGLVIGARTLAARPGIGWPLAAASTAADVTMEFVAQIAFVLIGLVLLLTHDPHSHLALPLVGVLAAAGLTAALTLVTQRRGILALRRLAERIGLPRLADAGDGPALEPVLDSIYRAPRRLAAGAALHLLGWCGSGIATWLAYRLLGQPIGLGAAFAIEALTCFSRALAFFVPASLGVQEAAYVGLGGLFGAGAGASLGVSLLRRARELVIGVPVLLIWQANEMRLARSGQGRAVEVSGR